MHVRTCRTRHFLIGPLALALLLCVRTPASAQTIETPLRSGVIMDGRLEASTPVRYGGFRYKIHPYTARAGEKVVISFTSSDFDPFLIVGRMKTGATNFQDLENTISQNDGGDGKDALLTYEFPQAGTYGIVTSAFNKGEQGAYQVVVWPEASAPTIRPARIPELPASLTMARLGQAVSGTLDDSSPTRDDRKMKLYWYVAEAGERVIATMRSNAFDSHLAVHGPFTGQPRPDIRFTEVDRDDDSGGGSDALLTYTFPRTGLYVFGARSFTTGGSGPYSFALFRPGTTEPRVALARAPSPTPAPQPAAPSVRTLEDAVALTAAEGRAEGMTLVYSETARLTRPRDFEVIASVDPGETILVMVLDENGLAPASIYSNIMQSRGGRLEQASEFQGMTGPNRRVGPALRSSGGMNIDRSWPRNTALRITVNAGPAFGSPSNVQVMIFKK